MIPRKMSHFGQVISHAVGGITPMNPGSKNTGQWAPAVPLDIHQLRFSETMSPSEVQCVIRGLNDITTRTRDFRLLALMCIFHEELQHERTQVRLDQLFEVNNGIVRQIRSKQMRDFEVRIRTHTSFEENKKRSPQVHRRFV
jgi:hypothetical protein